MSIPKAEATISKINKATQAKRNRELLKKAKHEEKAERKAQRKAERASSPRMDGEDPDLAGIVPGPQPSPFEET